ncbi:hypothetical protein FRC08_003413, partial [Ceratobasidium sp. 394]
MTQLTRDGAWYFLVRISPPNLPFIAHLSVLLAHIGDHDIRRPDNCRGVITQGKHLTRYDLLAPLNYLAFADETSCHFAV